MALYWHQQAMLQESQHKHFSSYRKNIMEENLPLDYAFFIILLSRF